MSMSLNQYMHPRNVFQTPPDFKDLAVRYPEFRKHVIYDLSGKVRLDFKNHESQRALSGTLLKHYFELDVHLPTDRLVPAVPQRLNYVLWLEDLLRLFPDKDSGVGIDIGTGASCILPLLGHKQCGWSFTATETDPVNLAHATENVKRNNLENHIKVVAVGSLREAHEAVEGDSTAVDFVVCNPPFFGSPEEADAQGRAEEQGRTPPSSDMSGAEEEKVWPAGGEVAFVRDVLLKDSLGLREKVRLYTVMLGKKSSVKQVMAELNEQGVNCTSTEFCQGKTMRWGVAWTFSDADLASAPGTRRLKSKPPLEFTLPRKLKGVKYCVPGFFVRIKELLQEVQVPFEVIADGKNMCHLWVKAESNTWSHQRRRRREMQRLLKAQQQQTQPETASEPQSQPEPDSKPDPELQQQPEDSCTEEATKRRLSEEAQTIGASCKKARTEIDPEVPQPGGEDRASAREQAAYDTEEVMEVEAKEDGGPVKDSQSSKDTLFLSCDVRVRRTANSVYLQLQTREGERESLHQLLQYFKNKLTFL
ncbi:U6 small nuclear RNA (adenine-(43)-N(6))-methyltransferase [Ixodes scapularis]|uniref:U6 small nuclear RNA (adenine-(43)-N(6))-methyltransferase n=1 Tax=Ixodes scapularis TaxID=6945 RepID=UPI001A9FDE5A|nr:U6 small nuclear RNA (adenine-(43)-N(6))-methyltransferase [Ixodes scapularis]